MSDDAAIAHRIDAALAAAVAAGDVPQVVLDLDGTLFDNVPRTDRILREVTRELLGEDHPVTEAVEGLTFADHAYSPVDTLRALGVTDEATLVRLREAWAERFFDSSYLAHDQPLAGAVDAAAGWWARGAELNYLTGRHVPDMFLGTVEALHEAGFPVGTLRTHVLMKPRFDAHDVAFKLEALPDVARKGPLVLIVDNDPRVLNALAAAAPEAIAVMVRTLHPADAPPPDDGLVIVDDFRDLIG